MKRIIIFTLVAAALMALVGCSSGGSADTSASAITTPQPNPTPVDMTMSGPKGNVGKVVYELAGMYMESSGKYIEWKRTTPGRAIAYCEVGNTDIAVIPRALKDEETTLYKSTQTAPLCTEALAVVAGADCPVDNITLEQLAKIYGGDITDWSDLGGSGAIAVYAITDEATAGNAFEELVLGLDENDTQITLDSSVCEIIDSAADMPGLIANNSLSIGFMPLSLIGGNGVKTLQVEGVAASEAVAKNGRYALSRPYNIVTVGEVSAEAQAFIDYCTTNGEAQAYLKQQGYILP